MKSGLRFLVQSIFWGLLALVAFEFLLASGAYFYRSIPRIKLNFDRSSVRVLCIGESTTQWGGVTSYPELLSELLDEKYGVDSYAVFNEGGNSTDTSMIEANLPEQLAFYQPSIVVAMMGINDPWSLGYRKSGELPLYSRLRIPKLILLARDLLFAESEIDSALERVRSADSRGDVDEGTREFVAIFRRFPGHPRLLIASDLRIGLANQAEGYDPRHYASNGRTQTNFRQIAALVKQSGARLIVMQYPLLDIAPLQEILKADAAGIVFAENKENFENALRLMKYEELFTDRFALSFGHPAEAGRRLLAQTAFEAIQKTRD